MASDGQYAIQYLGPQGWWSGHGGFDLPDPDGYVKRVRAYLSTPGTAISRFSTDVRLVDRETGEILGHPGCSICGEAHLGPDGGCLL